MSSEQRNIKAFMYERRVSLVVEYAQKCLRGSLSKMVNDQENSSLRDTVRKQRRFRDDEVGPFRTDRFWASSRDSERAKME